MDYRILDRIESPTDVKKLNNDEVDELCAEARDCILKTVSKNGGHLAANLGVVELTVAIHRVFSSPDDTVIFDVGHQCYTHKLLTGRYKDFDTLRTEGGISGFMRPEESVHDSFITGHSSTSVSSAYGVVKANELLKKDGYAVAVLGDGALAGGMVYEAFNNVKKKDKGFIVILNDNKMSISKNRGALSKHLCKIRTRRDYFRFKSNVEKVLIKIPLIGKPLRSLIFHIKLMLKNAIYDSNIFESLGFYYMGPVDGHNVKKITEMLEVAKEQKKPVLIHVKTSKGKGYAPAEASPELYHGVSGFDLNKGVSTEDNMSFSTVFGEELCALAEKDEKICAVTAAMSDGTGLNAFANKFKSRFFDVGIAEQHAVTFASSLAKCGFKPVFAVYSTFLQRGYDQLIHDAAIAALPLTVAVDRAGFVGADGETHQGLFDVSYLSSIPGVRIYAPSNYDELRAMLRERLSCPHGVAVIRYPRGAEKPYGQIQQAIDGDFTQFGSGENAIVTYGTLVSDALLAAGSLNKAGISTAVVKINIINPLQSGLADSLKDYKNVFFFEEGILSGGIAERLGFMLMSAGFRGSYTVSGVTGFVKQASVVRQMEIYGLDALSMVNKVKEVTGSGK